MTWQPAEIVFVDAEQLLCDRTRILLGDASVFVGNRIPTPRRDRMVIWNRDGGPESGVFEQARMRCRVWDTTDKKANDLARLLAARLKGDRTPPITNVVKESGPYDVPDESGSPQKYMFFTVTTRGARLS